MLRRLALASKAPRPPARGADAPRRPALRSFTARAAARRFGDHDPDAALGIDAAAAGAGADDVLEKVMGWLRPLPALRRLGDVALVHPRRGSRPMTEANAAGARRLAVGDAPSPRRRASAAAAAAPVEQTEAVGQWQKV